MSGSGNGIPQLLLSNNYSIRTGLKFPYCRIARGKPREKLVVITGLPGSGKSSRAFGTISRPASAAMSKAGRPMHANSWR
jgi:hypothetical protein